MITGMGTVTKTAPDLRDIAGYAAQMRVLEDQLGVLAEKRRVAAIRHYNNGVSLTDLGKAMGTSQPRASKIVHGGPSAKAASRGSRLTQ